MHRRPRAHHLRLVASFVVVTLVLLAGTTGWLMHSQRAFAATAPAYSHSWYINDVSTTGMNNLGAIDGVWDGSNCTNSLVVLDFGQPDEIGGVFGTHIYSSGYPFVTDSAIEQAAETYAHEWFTASPPCPRLTFAIGTNNGNACPSGCSQTAAGQAWAVVVNDVKNWISFYGYGWQMTVASADDIETEWDSASKTEQFVNGFNGSDNGNLLYDYGDATQQGNYPIGCRGYWANYDIWYVAWGASWDVPLPEIYHPYGQQGAGCPDQAYTWTTVESLEGHISIYGVMTECATSYNFSVGLSTCSSTYEAGEYAPSGSSGAWVDMWNAQNSIGASTSIFYATNIKMEGAS